MVDIILQPKFKWLRIAFFGVMFMALPAILDASFAAYMRYQLTNAPVNEYYENFGVVMSDVCYGDVVQGVTTHRVARNTDQGWKGEAVKELFRHDGETIVHISDKTVNTNFFIEVEKNGVHTREAAVPIVDVGTYHWEINIVNLYLPYGVVRHDVPPIITNTFEVKACNN